MGRYSFVVLGFLLVLSPLAALADMCALGSEEIDGNWFCQPVDAIQYSNVGSSGHYNRITAMNSDGTCHSVPQAFSGPISPLDGEVSFHVRGPTMIHQFAVYVPAKQGASKRNDDHIPHSAKHGKKHGHGHNGVAKNLHDRDEVTATIDGQVVSWENNYYGPSSVPASEVMVTATIDGATVSWLNNWFGPSSAAAPSQSSSAVATTLSKVVKPSSPTAPTSRSTTTVAPLSVQVPKPTNVAQGSTTVAQVGNTHKTSSAAPSKSSVFGVPPAGPGFDESTSFERISYYDGKSQNVENLVFLGNHGGAGSGVFDYHFGASLSYISSDATSGASSSQILAHNAIPSDSEVIIMHGDDCSDGSCGYVRPGSVAHHGFDGADKIFLIDFSMPMDGKTGFEGDMPSLWILHADIPRTSQYGPPECNCWTTGCGEFDIAEALFDGSTYLKSTLHTNTPAGDSDYIARPTSGSMKLAVIFSSASSTIHIQVLDDDFDFSQNLTAAEVESLCTKTNVSHFHVG